LGTGDVAPRGRGQGWRLRELEFGPRHLAALAVRRDRSVTVREFSWSKR
jgi:hypothetical protein